MAVVWVNDVLIGIDSTQTGTGTLNLNFSITGWRSPANRGVANNDTVYYKIYEVDAYGNPSGSFETGRGTYLTGPPRIQRDTVLGNSLDTTAKISFAAVDKWMSLGFPAEAMRLPNRQVINGNAAGGGAA